MGGKNSIKLFHYEFPANWKPHFYPPDDLKLNNLKDIKEFKEIIGQNFRLMKRFKIPSIQYNGKVIYFYFINY